MRELKLFLAWVIVFSIIPAAILTVGYIVGRSAEVVASRGKTWPVVVGGVNYQIDEVKIDGCEYLANHVHSGVALTHKGNCTNHRQPGPEVGSAPCEDGEEILAFGVSGPLRETPFRPFRCEVRRP